MEKNLQEEQTEPFLDQIMVIQNAHRAQRDEDSAAIEQLEHTNRVLKSEISSRVTSNNGEDAFFCDAESKISILQESLTLSEERTKQAESSLLFLTAKLGMRDDDLIIANNGIAKNRKDIRALKAKMAVLNTDLEYARITMDQNLNKLNAYEKDITSLNEVVSNQKKLHFESESKVYNLSENLLLAEMKVELMIKVIRAEIKFMSLLLQDSKNIDFDILSHELELLNGLAGTGSDEISVIICDFNIQNNKMFVNMREKKDNLNEIDRLNKSIASEDESTHALGMNEVLKEQEMGGKG